MQERQCFITTATFLPQNIPVAYLEVSQEIPEFYAHTRSNIQRETKQTLVLE